MWGNQYNVEMEYEGTMTEWDGEVSVRERFIQFMGLWQRGDYKQMGFKKASAKLGRYWPKNWIAYKCENEFEKFVLRKWQTKNSDYFYNTQ